MHTPCIVMPEHGVARSQTLRGNCVTLLTVLLDILIVIQAMGIPLSHLPPIQRVLIGTHEAAGGTWRNGAWRSDLAADWRHSQEREALMAVYNGMGGTGWTRGGCDTVAQNWMDSGQ